MSQNENQYAEKPAFQLTVEKQEVCGAVPTCERQTYRTPVDFAYD